MSDQHGDRTDDPAAPLDLTPAPIGAPPVDPMPEPSPYVAPAPVPARRGRRVATGVAVAIALVAGGFGILQLTAADGPQSPEAAVQSFFDAVDNDDVIGVIESLAPNERQILRDAVDGIKAEASRTKVAADDLDLHKVQGVDLQVRDLKMGVTPLSDGLAAVDLADGHVSTSADLDRMAVGPVIRELIDQRNADPDTKGEDGKAEGDIDLSGVRLATTRTDGAWHVSVLYSIAEQIRTDGDHVKAFPTGDPIPAKGADSPEAAVRQGIDALLRHDARRLIELAAPGEMDVLHTYGPILIANAEAQDGWAKEAESTKVSDLGLATTDGTRGAKIVSATSFKIHTEEDWGDGDLYTSDLNFDGRCTSVTTTAPSGSGSYASTDTYSSGSEDVTHEGAKAEPQTDNQKWCKGDQNTNGSFGLVPFAVFNPFFLFAGEAGAGGDLRVVTEEHGGAWYVSPARSIFESALTSLRALSDDDVRRQVRGLYGDEYWLLEPAEFWKACKVAQPGFDATRAEGEKAERDCYDALPDDYQGNYEMFGGRAQARFESVGSSIDGGDGSYGSGYDDPTASCYDDPAVNDAEGAAYDIAYHACLQRLFDEGKIAGSDLVADTCAQSWSDWYNTHDGDDPSDAESTALDDAEQQCQDSTPVPTRSDGSSGITVKTDGVPAAGNGPAASVPERSDPTSGD